MSCVISFEWFWVEFSKLVQPTVPTIEVLLEIDEVDGQLLDELQVVLTLIELDFVVGQLLHFIVFENLRKEVLLLISLLLYYLENYLSHLIDKFICVFAVIIL